MRASLFCTFIFSALPALGCSVTYRSSIEGKVIALALVFVRDNESFDQAFRRFKKSCEKAGILSEVKKREHYEKPSVRRKKKSLAARERVAKKARKGESFY